MWLTSLPEESQSPLFGNGGLAKRKSVQISCLQQFKCRLCRVSDDCPFSNWKDEAKTKHGGMMGGDGGGAGGPGGQQVGG